jgi:hypothetical protein
VAAVVAEGTGVAAAGDADAAGVACDVAVGVDGASPSPPAASTAISATAPTAMAMTAMEA